MVTALIVAGGKGTRMGAGINKVYLPLMKNEIISHTIAVFEKNRRVDEIVLVTGDEDIERLQEIITRCGFTKVMAAVSGGDSRQKSVYNGLKYVKDGIVLIHDGARALIDDEVINAVIDDCMEYGAAAPGVICKDTLKSADGEGFIAGTVDRSCTYHIQTPQAFGVKCIKDMHKRAKEDGFEGTDDCSLGERYGLKIKISKGSYENIKITTPEDILVAEKILQERMCRK